MREINGTTSLCLQISARSCLETENQQQLFATHSLQCTGSLIRFPDFLLLPLLIEKGVARTAATVHKELVNETIGKRRARAAYPIYCCHGRTPMTRNRGLARLREERCVDRMRFKIVSAVAS